MRDVEDALRQISSFRLTNQDRAAAVVQHPLLEKWLTSTSSEALLVHGNSRRHEPISPVSVACAMLVNFTTNMLSIVTLYWFCGSHTNGPNGTSLGMMRSLIGQLLSTSSNWDLSKIKPRKLDVLDLGQLFDLFTLLLKQLPPGTAVVCIVDGISFYEGSAQREDTCESVRKMAKLTSMERIIFKFLVTSPMRTNFVHRDSSVSKRAALLELPHHVCGAKNGFNHRAISESTEKKVRKLSQGLEMAHDSCSGSE